MPRGVPQPRAELDHVRASIVEYLRAGNMTAKNIAARLGCSRELVRKVGVEIGLKAKPMPRKGDWDWHQ